MADRTFSGDEVADALVELGYTDAGTEGFHRVLRYAHPQSDRVRTVTVPRADRLAPTALANVADQAEAHDVAAFRERIAAALES